MIAGCLGGVFAVGAGAMPTPADHLAVFVTRPVSAGSDFTITAEALTPSNHRDTSFSGSVTFTDSAGELSAPGANFSGGFASTSSAVIADAQKNDVVTATDAPLQAKSSAFDVTGPLDHILVSVTKPVSPDVQFALVAKAYDAAGNLLTGYDGSASFNDSTGTLAGAPTAFTDGVAQTGNAQIADAYKNDVITVLSGTTLGSSNAFSVIGPVAQILVSVTKPVTVGSSFSFVAKAYDAGGNLLTGDNDAVSFSDGTSTLSGAPTSFTNGVAQTSTAQISSASKSDQISASSDGVNGQSNAFSVLGSLDHLTVSITKPSGVSSNFTLTAKAYDSAGNVLTTDNDPVSFSDSSGSLSGAPTVFSNGVASSSSAQIADAYHDDVITVLSDGDSAQTPIFNVYGPLDHFKVSVPATASAGQAFTVTSTARDAAQNILTSYSGSATWSDKTATIAPSTPSSFVNGTSTTTGVTIGSADSTDRVMISSGGKTGQSVPFDVEPPLPPTAASQSFSGAVGNTPLGVGTTATAPAVNISGNLETGASDPNGLPITTVPENAEATTGGGSVTINSDGSFIYLPPAGAVSTSDTFSYELTDGEATTSPQTATVNISGARVWYVSASASGTGSGTSTDPFKALTSIGAVQASGDDAYVESGSYTGSYSMAGNETLIGSSQDLIVNNGSGNVTLIGGAGSNPSITGETTVANGATITGLDLHAAAGGPAVNASSVNGFTLTSSDTVGTAVSTDAIDISGGGGTISIAAPVTSTSPGHHSIDVSSRTGGTITVSGAVSDDGTGITLANNTGATIDFTGGVTASTASNPAFTATGGGTIEVTGSSNTLTTGDATALDVENTAISAGGLTFTSISAGSAGSAPLEGIIVKASGTVGGLTVTGTSTTAGSGGTIYNSKPAVGPGLDAAAVKLGTSSLDSSTAAPVGPMSLNDMALQAATGDTSGESFGVEATNASSFQLTNSTVTNEPDTGVLLEGFNDSGTFSIDSNTVVGSGGDGIQVNPGGNSVVGSSGHTLTGFIENNAIGNNTANSGAANGDGINVTEANPDTLTTTISGNTVKNVEQGYGITVDANIGTINATVTNNNVQNTDPNSLDGITVDTGNNGSVSGAMCVNPTGNTSHAVDTDFEELGFDAVGMSLVENWNSTVAFKLQGYTGPSNDGGHQVESLLNSTNTLSGPSDPTDESVASNNNGNSDFTNGTCSTPPGTPAIRTAASPQTGASPAASEGGLAQLAALLANDPDKSHAAAAARVATLSPKSHEAK